jgi:3-methyl-2-oxobutanoate hydroxymethyltransferase
MPAAVTIATLAAMKSRGEPIVCLTCYDASFARLLEAAGVDVLLVGDSLGMVLQGHPSTVPVTVDQMVYHSACVARGRSRALQVADLPFLACATPERALDNAARLLQEGGAQVVKLEGGSVMLPTVRRLAEQGVAVCAHLGLLPQSVHRLGGYRFAGRDPDSARRIREEARALEEAGAGLLVLECVPAALATSIAQDLRIPVIGIRPMVIPTLISICAANSATMAIASRSESTWAGLKSSGQLSQTSPIPSASPSSWPGL